MNEVNMQKGTLLVRLFDEFGVLKHEQIVNNLITDAGDLYQATRIAANLNSNGVIQPTLVNGMKLGTSVTAPSKNGTGAALVSYLAGGNRPFDGAYPQVVNLGAGAGVTVSYRCTWPAGQATSVSINEIAIVTDAGIDATSTAANTISRSVFGTTVTKAAAESLEVTWSHRQLGA
jgi:hypothetical protein